MVSTKHLHLARYGDLLIVEKDEGRISDWTIVAATKNLRGVIFLRCRRGGQRTTWVYKPETEGRVRLQVPASYRRMPPEADAILVKDRGDTEAYRDETKEVLTRPNTVAQPLGDNPEYDAVVERREQYEARKAVELHKAKEASR